MFGRMWILGQDTYGIPYAPYLVRITYGGEVVKRYPASCYELSDAAQSRLIRGDYAAAAEAAQQALNTTASVLWYNVG
jgi:hypothetical protein